MLNPYFGGFWNLTKKLSLNIFWMLSLFSQELVSWWWMIRYCFPLLVLRPSSTSSFVKQWYAHYIPEQSFISIFQFQFLLNYYVVEVFPARICTHSFEGNQKSRNSFRYNFSLGDLQIRTKYHCVMIHNMCFRINRIVTHAWMVSTHDENGGMGLDNRV